MLLLVPAKPGVLLFVVSGEANMFRIATVLANLSTIQQGTDRICTISTLAAGSLLSLTGEHPPRIKRNNRRSQEEKRVGESVIMLK